MVAPLPLRGKDGGKTKVKNIMVDALGRSWRQRAALGAQSFPLSPCRPGGEAGFLLKRLTNRKNTYNMLLLSRKNAWIRTSTPAKEAQRAARSVRERTYWPGEYPLGAGGQTVIYPVGPPGCDRYIAVLERPHLRQKEWYRRGLRLCLFVGRGRFCFF